MSDTRLTRTGQPVMGTTIEWQLEDDEDTWLPVKVVGKLYGRGGNSDLIGLIVETAEGARAQTEWPSPYWRRVS